MGEFSQEVRLDDLDSVQLVLRARAGERESEEALFRRYLPRLTRIARSWRRSAGLGCEPSDIVQSALRRAQPSLGSFDPHHERAVAAWFATILRHTLRDKRRRARTAKRGDGCVPQDLHELGEVARPASAPRSVLDSLADDELAGRVFGCLTARELELVTLRTEEGQSWAEVARRVGLENAEIARKRYATILARVRATLARDLD